MASTVFIAPNVQMPLLGLGTYQILGAQPVESALDAALSAGYRFFDTAQLYSNEREIGDALKILLPKHGLKRGDVFITTKLHIEKMGAEKTSESLEESLKKLQLDAVDLFLVHFPKPSWLGDRDEQNKTVRLETWREMEKLLDEGKTRAIGVSNYEIKHLMELKDSKVRPAVNQCEFHPHFRRTPLLNYCKENKIHLQGFTTLARNNPKLHKDPVLVELAEKHQASTSQIILAWAMHLGVSVLPKSTDAGRIKSNFDSTKVRLSEEEVKKIDAVDKNQNYTSCNPWDVL